MSFRQAPLRLFCWENAQDSTICGWCSTNVAVSGGYSCSAAACTYELPVVGAQEARLYSVICIEFVVIVW